MFIWFYCQKLVAEKLQAVCILQEEVMALDDSESEEEEEEEKEETDMESDLEEKKEEGT